MSSLEILFQLLYLAWRAWCMGKIIVLQLWGWRWLCTEQLRHKREMRRKGEFRWWGYSKIGVGKRTKEITKLKHGLLDSSDGMWASIIPEEKCMNGWNNPGESIAVIKSIGFEVKQTYVLILSIQKESQVAQSCLTLCDPMDCSTPGSSIHGISQARVLEWLAISFPRGSSWARDRTGVSLIAGRRFTVWATREAPVSTKDFDKFGQLSISLNLSIFSQKMLEFLIYTVTKAQQ